jgi:hypothetical protein
LNRIDCVLHQRELKVLHKDSHASTDIFMNCFTPWLHGVHPDLLLDTPFQASISYLTSPCFGSAFSDGLVSTHVLMNQHRLLRIAGLSRGFMDTITSRIIASLPSPKSGLISEECREITNQAVAVITAQGSQSSHLLHSYGHKFMMNLMSQSLYNPSRLSWISTSKWNCSLIPCSLSTQDQGQCSSQESELVTSRVMNLSCIDAELPHDSILRSTLNMIAIVRKHFHSE